MKQLEQPLNGHHYQVGKLNALDQFHVARRLGPMLASMGVSLAHIKKLGTGQVKETDMVEIILPAMGALSAMQNDDVDYIVNKCMSVVERQDSDRWAKVQVAGRFMFEDIDMLVMLQLTFEVCKHNLMGFLPGLSGLINSPSP